MQARLVYPWAVEATIWGMPAVSMAAIRRKKGIELAECTGEPFDLVAGSGIAFIERGAHQLKAVPGDWQLFALNS